MGTTMSMSGLLAIRLRELQVLRDRSLYEGTSRFLQALFRDPQIRPATLRLRRTERPVAERFFDEQCKVLLEIASLFGDFLELYPHPQTGGRYRCGAPQCDERLSKLQQLLQGPVSDLDGRGSTSARDAVECLRACHTAHVYATSEPGRSAQTTRMDDRLAELWVKHTSRCWERAEWLRTSPGRSLDVLLAWTMGAVTLTAREARDHIARVGRELLAVADGLDRTEAVFERFRHVCEERDIPVLRAIAERSGPALAASFVTARAEEHFSAAGLPAWSFSGRRRPSPALGSLVVDAIAHDQDDPVSEVYDGISRFHARLAGAADNLDEAVLLVLRVGGPGCELPRRLEFERFAMSLVPVDLREGRAASSERVRVEAEPILEAICRSNADEVPPTLRTVKAAGAADAASTSTRYPPVASRLGALMRFAGHLCPGKS